MKGFDIEKVFAYHAPFGTQKERYVQLRLKAKELAEDIDHLCPDSREKSLAMTQLQQAVMFANASIAIHEVPPPAEASAPAVVDTTPIVQVVAKALADRRKEGLPEPSRVFVSPESVREMNDLMEMLVMRFNIGNAVVADGLDWHRDETLTGNQVRFETE